MRRVFLGLSCGLLALTLAGPAQAAGSPHGSSGQTTQAPATDWSAHDSAMYVVSTINVLRTRSGNPLSNIMQRRMGVKRFNVYADLAVSDQYYIDLVKADGTVAGTLAYKMGWQKPMSASPGTDRLRITHAPDSVVLEYRTDRKLLIGSFTSTLPS